MPPKVPVTTPIAMATTGSAPARSAFSAPVTAKIAIPTASHQSSSR